ncbi:MAG: hypothetical protein M4579_007100 [Chaenotheca gracillima]|nr:MAG: hypothetical protein M4579_007100 [Chaenotheca gracillima]
MALAIQGRLAGIYSQLCPLRIRTVSIRLHATSSATKQNGARPSIAPKPIVNVKHIRQNPDLYATNCANRNYKAQSTNPAAITSLFEEWQMLQKNSRTLKERNNQIQRKLAESGFQIENGTPGKLLEEARHLKIQLTEIELKESQLESRIHELAIELPNLTSSETPLGTEPKLLRYINEPLYTIASDSDRIWRSHVDIGAELQLLDFGSSGVTTGWGWYFLLNEAVKLEQALVGYACSVAEKRGWMLVSPPSMVYAHIASACGFRPRDQHGEQQSYSIEQGSKRHLRPEICLAGTAEILLAGMKANQTFEEQELPHKVVGSSRCYRAEAGARGVDTKGLYRVHEFTKVEMFAWTRPDEAQEIFDNMVSVQIEILQSLGLVCRVLEMPSNDLGASAFRKQDIEAYFPARRGKDAGWGEVTSASICTDYQSRRLGTRMKNNKSDRKVEWPHTLNGTALAVPRVLAAILENGWDEEQRLVRLPPVLKNWMGGIDTIQSRRKSSVP